MRKTLLVAAACGALLAASTANAAWGGFGGSGSIFGQARVQTAAYNFFNPTPTTGVNAIRPPGTEPLTKTANNVIYALFGVSNFTWLFGLR